MGSNFLGDVGVPARSSQIVSGGELMAREGVELHKSMNFRDSGGLLSVFLVLRREEEFKDEWNEDSEIYTFEGHDSTTVENGKSVDQIAMYPDGRMSDNGKFLKAATNFKDRVRREPLQVQIYEKLDPGVWYDKGIFNLVDAKHIKDGNRKVYKFYLNPAGTREGSQSDDSFDERMINAGDKEKAWLQGKGRCVECGKEGTLNFVGTGKKVELRCALHGGRKKRGFLD